MIWCDMKSSVQVDLILMQMNMIQYRRKYEFTYAVKEAEQETVWE